jgi:BRCA1-associated RING domain protein 1
MKSDEQKSKQNGDVNKKDKDKTLNSDIPESPSLSPFFWLREEEENEGGTAETLSEPPSLDTPLRHNAPTFSDIKDSDDERPIDMTPNVSYLEHVFLFFSPFFWFPGSTVVLTVWLHVLQSKAEVSEIFDSEIFEWSQRPCSPELRSTPLKSQVFWLTETEALYFQFSHLYNLNIYMYLIQLFCLFRVN